MFLENRKKGKKTLKYKYLKSYLISVLVVYVLWYITFHLW